ncbi:MAG: DNA-formamidopyrimidine glycosylase family protein [Gemmatimonadota bacterium]|nr:DNA-formamidopyrimidine glycosylase family protein [Gemmatimonadota bacterium]
MIELPDVERMIDTIAGYTTGKTISSVLIDDVDVVDLDVDLVEDHLEDHAIESVERHGRYVLLKFRSDYSLLFDMGDDGHLRLESQTAPATERTKIRLQFAAGRELRFSSSGSEGVVRAVREDEISEGGALEELGIDPLSEDLTPERFASLADKGKRLSLKGFLMNEKIIAGIGNDYADEICFQSGFRPDEKVANLEPEHLYRVHRYLRRVLRRATLHWSAAHSDPGWLINSRGNGDACPRCRHELTSVRITGRKTLLCPRCQRAA